MEGLLANLDGSSLAGGRWAEGIALVSLDSRRVVMKGNYGIVGNSFWQSGLDHFEERFWLFLSVNDHFASKEPMSRVFRVGLTHVETFHVGRVATEFLL
jgi:hypothetical protein